MNALYQNTPVIQTIMSNYTQFSSLSTKGSTTKNSHILQWFRVNFLFYFSYLNHYKPTYNGVLCDYIGRIEDLCQWIVFVYRIVRQEKLSLENALHLPTQHYIGQGFKTITSHWHCIYIWSSCLFSCFKTDFLSDLAKKLFKIIAW